jgi:hypothetical protein
MEILLQSLEFHPEIRLDEAQLINGLNAIAVCHDKNIKDKNVPVMIFWPQKLINDSWVAWPENLKVFNN